VTRGAGPSWSPDSSRLAVVRRGHVWVARADGRAVRRVSRPEKFSFARAIPGRPLWTPNGRRIIFPRESYFPGELMTVSPQGGRPRRLTRNRIWETEPAWSPDGRMVAFTGVGLHDEQEIYVVRADGTQLRRLTRRPGPDSKPAWSPDGKRIVFVRDSRDGAVLYVVPSAGGKPRPIHRLAPRNGGSPSWAPASWIAINGIELVSGRGLSRGRATRPPPNGFDLQPDWAPDGRRFAFVRQVAYDCRDCLATYLMVGRVGNRGVRRVAKDLIAPAWSPDGSRIAAVMLEGGGLVTVRPDGSGRRVLAVGLDESTEIDWGPAP
jgi:Tol biopolymer transport system component